MATIREVAQKKFDTVIRILDDNPMSVLGKEYLMSQYGIRVLAEATKEAIYEELKTKLGLTPLPPAAPEATPTPATEATTDDEPDEPRYYWYNGKLMDMETGCRATVVIPVEFSRDVSTTTYWTERYAGDVSIRIEDLLDNDNTIPSHASLVERAEEAAAEYARDHAEAGDRTDSADYDYSNEDCHADTDELEEVSAYLERIVP